MSLLIFEGFSAGANSSSGADVGSFFTPKWSSASLEVNTGHGRHGVGGGPKFTTMLSKVFPASQKDTKFIVGCALMNPTAGGAAGLITLGGDAGATSHLMFGATGSGSIEMAVYRGGSTSGTLLGTTSGAGMSASGWRYIEIEAVLSDSVGSVKIWSDGVQVLNLTGIDTRNGGTDANFDWVSFNQWINNIDDLYVLNGAGASNNSRLGDVRIVDVLVDGNGASSQWTGSDGNSTDNYLLVDDKPAVGASDYVEAGTSDLVDTYTFGNVTLTTDDRIIAVGVHAHAYKGDTGSRSIALLASSGGSTSTGSDQQLNTTASLARTFYQHFETDPNTAAAWTEAGHNAAEVGIKSRP